MLIIGLRCVSVMLNRPSHSISIIIIPMWHIILVVIGLFIDHIILVAIPINITWAARGSIDIALLDRMVDVTIIVQVNVVIKRAATRG